MAVADPADVTSDQAEVADSVVAADLERGTAEVVATGHPAATHQAALAVTVVVEVVPSPLPQLPAAPAGGRRCAVKHSPVPRIPDCLFSFPFSTRLCFFRLFPFESDSHQGSAFLLVNDTTHASQATCTRLFSKYKRRPTRISHTASSRNNATITFLPCLVPTRL